MTAAEFAAVMEGFGRFHGADTGDAEELRNDFNEALAAEYAAGRL